MRRPRLSTLAELVLIVALAVVSAWVFGRTTAKQAGDEANWVGTAHYFRVLFVRHDLSAESWQDDHWTRTQPMLPRYILGGWLSAHGYEYEHLDPYFNHQRKWFSNVEDGKAPDEPTLAEARVPMRGLAALSALLMYGIVRVVAGPVGGAVAALLFIGSPYLQLHLVRAMGEPPFIAFLLATLLACLFAIVGRGSGPLSWRWGILAGTLLGLALASKLTAVIGIAGIVAWGIWAAVGPALVSRVPLLRRWDDTAARTARPPHRPPPAPGTQERGSQSERRPSPPEGAGWVVKGNQASGRGLQLSALVWALGVVVVGLLVFVLSNPYLYRDPVGRTLLMFQNRQVEMAEQAAADSSRAVPTLSDSARRVLKFSLVEDTWADSQLRWPLDAPLALVGFVWLAGRGLRPRPGPESLVLLSVVGFYSGVTLGLGYVLDHYFVPTATMGTALSGLAVGWSTQWAWQAARHAIRRRRPTVSQANAAAV